MKHQPLRTIHPADRIYGDTYDQAGMERERNAIGDTPHGLMRFDHIAKIMIRSGDPISVATVRTTHMSAMRKLRGLVGELERAMT